MNWPLVFSSSSILYRRLRLTFVSEELFTNDIFLSRAEKKFNSFLTLLLRIGASLIDSGILSSLSSPLFSWPAWILNVDLLLSFVSNTFALLVIFGIVAVFEILLSWFSWFDNWPRKDVAAFTLLIICFNELCDSSVMLFCGFTSTEDSSSSISEPISAFTFEASRLSISQIRNDKINFEDLTEECE